MKISGFDVDLQCLMAPVPIWHARVTVDEWRAAAAAVREGGGRLLAMWGGAGLADEPMVVACAAYVVLEGLIWLELPLDGEQLTYPDLL
ncbi:MAG TPA: Ni,Fe-hydrogenase III large subunit, partial [Rhodoferax sp.]